MKALIVTKKFNKKNLGLIKLTKELIKKKVIYEIVDFDDIEDFHNSVHDKKFINTYDIMISFGGDGTILKSARIARKLDIPILGINAGTIGYLTSINDIKEVGKYIDKIKNKDFVYEERYMLCVEVKRNKKTIFKSYAVNEATITTSTLVKMGQYEVCIGDVENVFNEYRADGIIVSSPTGSTGHSLSAGGPIVAPDVNCFIITAICPHAFNQRSIVINSEKSVYIRNLKEEQLVDIDGRITFNLDVNDVIKISKLNKVLKFITFEKNHFIKNIKAKIRSI